MKTLLTLSSAIALAFLLAACGSQEGTTAGKVIKSSSAGNNLTVTLSTSDGVVRRGNTEFTLSFTDASGQTIDVGAVALVFHMPQMGTMAEMNDAATFTTTETSGVYRGKANVQMGGEWQVRVTYEGPKGKGQASFPVTVQ